MDILSPCTAVYQVHAWCPWKPKEVKSLGIRVTDGCELLSGCWKQNPDPLKKQQVLLLAEPLLQSSWFSGLRSCKDLNLVPDIYTAQFLQPPGTPPPVSGTLFWLPRALHLYTQKHHKQIIKNNFK